MRVSVVLTNRLCRTPDGAVWNQGPPDHGFFVRYLAVFSEVNVVSRVRDVPRLEGAWRRVDGERVSVSAMPHFVGLLQYMRRYREVMRSLRRAVDARDALILRDYGRLGGPLAARFAKGKRPFGLEVIGDPYDVFAPGVIRHPMRPLIRRLACRRLRAVCRKASAVTYVTQAALQARYPASASAFTTHFSSIQLPDEAFAARPRQRRAFADARRLLFVGSLAQPYKGGHVLIDALGRHLGPGVDWTLAIVGDGKYRKELERRARELDVDARVRFLGKLAGPLEVRQRFAEADLFVLPSLTEGLPRALIEAMAAALPCIATSVGGIPELLPEADRVPRGDAIALAARIREVIASPQRMAEMSARNLEKARLYRESVLAERRDAFYRHIQSETEGWQIAAAPLVRRGK